MSRILMVAFAAFLIFAWLEVSTDSAAHLRAIPSFHSQQTPTPTPTPTASPAVSPTATPTPVPEPEPASPSPTPFTK